MEILGRGLKAVAFDLDGTLYPNYRLYQRLILFIIKNPRFFLTFVAARRQLHRPERQMPPDLSFYDDQAAIMADILGKPKEEVKEKVERLIYLGWEKRFAGVKPFSRVRETLTAFRDAGLRLAILSDFPPKQKISMLGLDGLFEFILSTEEAGALKPSSVPFAALTGALKVNAGEILFVGNSAKYDIAGARMAGMKTALINKGILSTGYNPGTGGADFVFRNYRQLRNFVLG
jgi:putative hydrolase of the HAD superfamily